MTKKISLISLSHEAMVHAATAISKFTHQEVEIEIFHTELKNLSELQTTLNPEGIQVSVCLPIGGDLHGAATLLFSTQDAAALAKLLTGQAAGMPLLSISDIAVLKEVGNILAGNYLTILGNYLEIRVVAKVPLLIQDMSGAILEQIAVNFLQEAEKVFKSEIGFKLKSRVIRGHLLVCFEAEQMKALPSLRGGGGVSVSEF